MHITGGRFKGKTLQTPKGDSFRPSSGIVKESLFNILYGDVVEAVWLDLFAGSGAVGIEALSRGAESVVFVESSHEHAGFIVQNIKCLNLDDSVKLLVMQVEKAVEKFGVYEFDIIFMDPPYSLVEESYITSLLTLISDQKILKSGGWLILESLSCMNVENIKVDGLELTKNKKYGKSMLSFWTYEG